MQREWCDIPSCHCNGCTRIIPVLLEVAREDLLHECHVQVRALVAFKERGIEELAAETAVTVVARATGSQITEDGELGLSRGATIGTFTPGVLILQDNSEFRVG